VGGVFIMLVCSEGIDVFKLAVGPFAQSFRILQWFKVLEERGDKIM